MLVARCCCVQCGVFNPQLEMEESEPETEESEIEVDLVIVNWMTGGVMS